MSCICVKEDWSRKNFSTYFDNFWTSGGFKTSLHGLWCLVVLNDVSFLKIYFKKKYAPIYSPACLSTLLKKQ